MAGISSKALKPNYTENKRKYNGIEYDGDLDLDTYEAYYRNLDPQTARWWQIDPEIDNGYESVSPYASMYDDPIRYSDPLGNEGDDCCKVLWNTIKGGLAAHLDNATGGLVNLRGTLAPSADDAEAVNAYNAAQNAADITDIVMASDEVIGGEGMSGGATLVTAGTGGASSEVTVPVAVGGQLLAGHGWLMGSRAAHNLLTQNGRVQAKQKESPSNAQKKPDAPGQTASGHPTDKHGNKLGPSGKPQVNTVKHASQKRAKDAARAEGKRAPVKHTNPNKGGDHYHPTDKEGNKIPNSTHHEYQ